ncbi:hypothetical protein [Acetobacter sp.]|uniref:hypothetical protein n=1 Tax=Acetobacter sp. TaxID=440 RepID=UPI0039EC5137
MTCDEARFVKTALSLFCVTAFCLASPAMAQEESLSSAAENSVPNEQLRKELAVLQSNPDEASDSCVNAMKELHATQAKIAEIEDKSTSPDMTVAKDVLESDFESAIEMCGPDARRVCSSESHPSDKLAKACAVLKADSD